MWVNNVYDIKEHIGYHYIFYEKIIKYSNSPCRRAMLSVADYGILNAVFIVLISFDIITRKWLEMTIQEKKKML